MEVDFGGVVKYLPDMSDQVKPKLTLEEELDVLEAVYKIGQEKGLELLRPEQVKKLKDAGRMGLRSVSKSDKQILAADLLENVLEKVIGEVLIKHGIYSKVDWEQKPPMVKRELVSAYSALFFGFDLDDIDVLMKRTTTYVR